MTEDNTLGGPETIKQSPHFKMHYPVQKEDCFKVVKTLWGSYVDRGEKFFIPESYKKVVEKMVTDILKEYQNPEQERKDFSDAILFGYSDVKMVRMEIEAPEGSLIVPPHMQKEWALKVLENEPQHYKIIVDEQKLKEFIDWLPELQPHEKYYLCLFARSKYCKQVTHISSDKAQLKRVISDKSRMFEKIKQMEIRLGDYKQKEVSVPQEALALYITVNPRSMTKATANLLVKLATSMRDQNIEMNPHAEALSQIQKAKSRTEYIDFDIDEPDEDVLKTLMTQIEEYITKDAITWLRTRGGAHCLIKPSLIPEDVKKTFHRRIALIPQVDQVGDQMIPIPGTYQGGFVPHFITK